ncbi:MAG TPA: hypothetical protein VHC69_34805 [Polyangiaceae bacterium]|nr:hypothetical protein [Polyangiaceae bacterium]
MGVLTLPFELRGRLSFDGKLLGTVARLFVDSQRRRHSPTTISIEPLSARSTAGGTAISIGMLADNPCFARR